MGKFLGKNVIQNITTFYDRAIALYQGMKHWSEPINVSGLFIFIYLYIYNQLVLIPTDINILMD